MNNEQNNRPEPEFQENHQAQPWFVNDNVETHSFNGKTKRVVKKTMSVLFPLLGLAIIISLTGLLVFYVMRLY